MSNKQRSKPVFNLTERLQKREQSALTELIERYQNQCIKIFQRCGVTDERDIQECLDDVWLCIWEKAETPIGYELGTAVLNAAARIGNACAGKLQKEQEELLEDLSARDIQNVRVSFFAEPEQVAVAKEQALLFSETVLTLREREASILIRHDYFDDTFEAIGKTYGVGKSSVRQSWAKGKVKLRHPTRRENCLDAQDMLLQIYAERNPVNYFAEPESPWMPWKLSMFTACLQGGRN